MTAIYAILLIIAITAGLILLISWIILPFKVADILKTLKLILEELRKENDKT